MFPNLRAEMARINIKNTHIAEALTLNYDSVSNKNRGKTEYSLSEALKLRDTFFPNMSLEYLFESEKINEPCTKPN